MPLPTRSVDKIEGNGIALRSLIVGIAGRWDYER